MSPQNTEAALAEIRASFRKHGQPSWDDVRNGLARASRAAGEWAGYPMPMEGTRMVIHKSYPFAAMLGQAFMPQPSLRACYDEDVREDCECRNQWYSYRDGKPLSIWRDGKKFRFFHGKVQNSAPMIVSTIGAARAWDINAEIKAMETLRRHVTEWAFNCYLMTGMFIESSKRSGVFYVFRRLRPTIALTGNPDRLNRECGLRILCCLCAHPIGYYDGSWAGALVPTDDVISHLLLMRSDEHLYWKNCNQHPAWAPESGL